MVCSLSKVSDHALPEAISHRRCARWTLAEIFLHVPGFLPVTCWSTMFAQFHRLENTLRCESLTCSTWWMKIHPKSTLSVTFQQSLSGIRLKSIYPLVI